MNLKVNKEDLQNPTTRAALIRIIDGAKHGGFMAVNGLTTKTGHGEKSNYVFGKGISYPAAVEKSLSMLDAIEANPDFSITVTRGVWTDGNGKQSPTNRKSKEFNVPKTVTQTYKHGDYPLLAAITKVRISLVAPAAVTKEYKNLGNGIYEDEDGTIFLRDLRLVSKTVIVKGDYPFTAKGEDVAIADAIKRDMPIGNYRQFRFDSDYENITLDGVTIEEAIAVEAEAEAETAHAEVEAETEPA